MSRKSKMADAFGGPLRGYWEGIGRALSARIESVREYLKHPSSGFVAEEFFRALIRDHVPRRYCVDTGFVVDSSQTRSSFIDIIVADSFEIAPFCVEPTYRVFPIESVCAVIEVTISPNHRVDYRGKDRDKFEADILKLAEVRGMGKNRRYQVKYWESQEIPERASRTAALSPRAFLMTAGDEWAEAATYETHLAKSLRSAKAESEHTWINAAYSMKHGLLKYRPCTVFEHDNWIKDDSLFHFIFMLLYGIQTFALPNAALDVNAYRSMPKEEEEEQEPTSQEQEEEFSTDDQEG